GPSDRVPSSAPAPPVPPGLLPASPARTTFGVTESMDSARNSGLLRPSVPVAESSAEPLPPFASVAGALPVAPEAGAVVEVSPDGAVGAVEGPVAGGASGSPEP